jgi:hypothetical protein
MAMQPTRVGTGDTIGRYELLRPLGSGGSGTVFEAMDALIGRRVAVKLLHIREGAANARRAEARFLREGRIAAQIRHPHVVDVFDVGIDNDVPFLVMELVEGETLADLIAREERLAVARAVEIVLPILSATAELHASGVIHRDIKPANVLMPAGHALCPKLADFGASWCDSDAPPITRPGSLVGTPEYLAPELIRFGKRATERSDQYAIGVLLYEAVTGGRPFEGPTTYQRLLAAVSADLVPPSARCSSVSADFDAVIVRAMHRDPLRRFPDVEALGKALLGFVASPVAERWREVFEPLRPGLRATVRATVGSALSAPLSTPLSEAVGTAPAIAAAPSRPEPGASPAVARARGPAAAEPSVPDDRTLLTKDGVAVVVRGDLMSMVWQASARIQRTRWVFDLMDALAQRRPGGILVLMVILPTADPPDRPAREENARRIRRVGEAVRSLSTVVLGDGVQQVLIRSVIRAMVLPHRRSVVESTLDSSIAGGIARLLHAAGPHTPSLAQMADDVCAMHAALGVPLPPEHRPRAAPSGATPGTTGAPSGLREPRPVRQSA